MRLALDTNILAYAEGVNGAAMKRASLELVEKLPQDTVLLPVQALGELLNVLVRKAGRSPARARRAILTWQDAFPLIETSAEVMLAATDLATDHQLSIWESVIFSATAAAGCCLLLLEDLVAPFQSKKFAATKPRGHIQDHHQAETWFQL